MDTENTPNVTEADLATPAVTGGPTEETVAGTGGDSPQDNANASAVEAIAEQNEHTAEVNADRESGRDDDLDGDVGNDDADDDTDESGNAALNTEHGATYREPNTEARI